MPAVSFKGSTCSGHGSHPPRVSDSGSEDVFVNGQGALRVGDHWVVHTSGKDSHDSTQAEGSSTVYVNGKPLARIGDAIACGSVCAVGSRNVFAGG